MSHSVTIRTVTTTNSSSTILLNTGYLKTGPGLLKLLELILGIATVVTVLWNYQDHHHHRIPLLFFLLVATTFLIGTSCLILSCVLSWSTGGLISKTVYEFLYHLIAAVALLVASILLFVRIEDYKPYYFYQRYLIVSIAGVINAVLYFISTLLASRSYRGL